MSEEPRDQVAAQSVVAALTGVGLAALVVLASWFVLDDLGSQGEKFDGLGLAVGGAMLVLPLLSALALLAWWRRRGRRTGWLAVGVAALLVGVQVAWLSILGWW